MPVLILMAGPALGFCGTKVVASISRQPRKRLLWICAITLPLSLWALSCVHLIEWRGDDYRLGMFNGVIFADSPGTMYGIGGLIGQSALGMCPRRPTFILPTWPVLLIAVLWLLYGQLRARRARRARRCCPVPTCPRCGYNLTGNTSGTCSECGTATVS